MKLNKCKLGDIITQRREKYSGEELPICGVTREGFIPPKQKDADISLYNVFHAKDFVFNPARMELNSIVFNDVYEKALCSSLYEIFFVNKPDIVLPEFLALIVKRNWFTRYCEFLGSGSAREYCRVANISQIEIEYPDIEEQRKIVQAYKTITDRIELKKKINNNLEATAQAIFKSLFVDYEGAEYPDFVEFEFGKYPASWNLVDLDSVVDVRDGTHDSPSPTESGKYLITSRHLLPYAVDRSDAYFISEVDFKKANERSKVEYGDILFSMIGTIGIISFITDKKIDFAIKNVGLFRTSQNPSMRYFLLSYLKSKIVENYIASYMAGSTQSYVSLNVLRKIPLILPTEDVLQHFEKQVTPLYAKMIENTHEITKLNDLKNVIITSMSSR